MRRRDLIASLAAAAMAEPLAARAQQRSMPVIGFLSASWPGQSEENVMALREGLSETGFVEGKNLQVEYRWAEGSYDRLPALAGELVSRRVELIVTGSGIPAALAAKNATSIIPIVFEVGIDPIAAGLVASLGRPGGNLTGVSFLNVDLTTKRLELLAELVPHATTISLLVNPNNSNAGQVTLQAQQAAKAKGLQVDIVRAGTEAEIDGAFATLVQRRAGALLVGGDPFLNSRREQIIALAARHAVPAIYSWREAATVGGLISYAASLTPIYRQVGIYAGKILKGAKPADLPVEQPTKFELVINLKTAKVLGLTVPPSLLVRAEVIE
jgi:putative ABC transport system substrate-binding protein